MPPPIEPRECPLHHGTCVSSASHSAVLFNGVIFLGFGSGSLIVIVLVTHGMHAVPAHPPFSSGGRTVDWTRGPCCVAPAGGTATVRGYHVTVAFNETMPRTGSSSTVPGMGSSKLNALVTAGEPHYDYDIKCDVGPLTPHTGTNSGVPTVLSAIGPSTDSHGRYHVPGVVVSGTITGAA